MTDDTSDVLAELQPDLSLEIGKEQDATTAQQQASATAALRVMRAIERDRAEIREARRLERDSISQIEARELAPLNAKYDALERWVSMLAELIQWGKKKSHDTPYGVFGIRSYAATVKLVDDEKAIAWVKEATNRSADFVHTMESLNWKELKKVIDVDGELPAGVERIEATIKPYVTLG